jgi:hypothetical protein
MIANPLAPRSTISFRALAELASAGPPAQIAPEAYRLSNVHIEDQAIPDFDVRLDARVARLEADGVLGRDFFALFKEVCWAPRTDRLTLSLSSPSTDQPSVKA